MIHDKLARYSSEICMKTGMLVLVKIHIKGSKKKRSYNIGLISIVTEHLDYHRLYNKNRFE